MDMASETQLPGQAKRRRTTSRTQESRWADLPTGVLLSVAYKAAYPSSALYAAVGHVCTRWRAAIASAMPPGPFPCQLPVLALQPLPATSRREPITDFPKLRTYGVPRVLESDIPGVVGSCHGWLVVLDPDAAHLAVRNPATGHVIHFPSLRPVITSCPPNVDVHRVIVSHAPALRRDFVVLLFLAAVTTRCFTFRGGADAWAAHAHREFLVEDVIFFSGRFIAVDQENNLAMFEWQANDHHHLAMTTRRLEPRMSEPSRTPVASYGSVFLVELRGSLLVATVWCDRGLPSPPEIEETRRSQQILEVDLSTDSGVVSTDSGVVLVANERLDLGGHAVFLGHGNSVAVEGAHFPALGTDVIFCPIRRRTVSKTKLFIFVRSQRDTKRNTTNTKNRFTNGDILISPYNPRVCTTSVTVERTETPAEVWSSQLLRPFWVVPNLLGVESRKKKRISTAFYDFFV